MHAFVDLYLLTLLYNACLPIYTCVFEPVQNFSPAIEHNGRSYYYYARGVTARSAAQRACMEMEGGATVITIGSEEENTFIQNHV